MKILGLIVARSGSKGVLNKNLKLLGNKPLLDYTIDAAQSSTCLHEIVLSTDSLAYVDFASSKGISVPFVRPAALAMDNTPAIDVVLHAVESLEMMGKYFDAVCLLQPTHPFRKKGSIDAAIYKFINADSDSLVSVLSVPHEFNPHWIFESNKDGFLGISTGEKEIIKRRQDLPQAFFRDGSIYITKTSVIKNSHSLYGDKIAYIESDPFYYVNIDTQDDWKKAKEKLIQLNSLN